MKILHATIIFTLAFFLFNSFAIAHGMTEEEKTVEEIMSEIMSKQNVTSANQVDCKKISDVNFEDLGDAVMQRMVGSQELHDQMDLMMGGEGSVSLMQMHVAIGRNWLGCVAFSGMMGEVNFMPMMMRMMGNYYPGYFVGYNSLLIFSATGWLISAILMILILTGKVKLRKK